MIGIGNNQLIRNGRGPIGPVPVLEDVTNVESKYGSTTGLTYTLPAVMNVGDIILATFSQGSVGLATGYTVTAPGWTQYQNYTAPNPTTFFWLWHRVDGTEGSTVTFSINYKTTYYVQFARVSGCKTTGTPFENLTKITASAISTITVQNAYGSQGDNRLALIHSAAYGRFNSDGTHLTDTLSGYIIADFEAFITSKQYYIWTQEIATAGTYDGYAQYTTPNTLTEHGAACIMLIPLNG